MNKVAVVTGAAKGLGRGVALHLANEGFSVVVHFNRSEKEAASVLKRVKSSSENSISLSADLRLEKEVSKMFDAVLKRFGRVDLLVNNVGNFIYKKLSETTNGEFRDILESNIYSTLYSSRAVLPAMRRQGSGNIINIGADDAARFMFREKVIPYYLAKNGVYVLTKAMAWEEGKMGVRINMVSPGPMAMDIFKKSDFPMDRATRPRDVIAAIDFLLSRDAYYINGANIEVSGGFIAGAK